MNFENDTILFNLCSVLFFGLPFSTRFSLGKVYDSPEVTIPNRTFSLRLLNKSKAFRFANHNDNCNRHKVQRKSNNLQVMGHFISHHHHICEQVGNTCKTEAFFCLRTY